MTDIRTFDQIGPDDGDTVGGKGLSLARLTGAGLPVPPGFCVTSAAYRRLHGQSLRDDTALTDAITRAYQDLGGGPTAVRSSATAEDSATASFAGQQETILGVTGEAAVLDAVDRCWRSLDSARAVAYRQHQKVDERGLAMAVVVQRLVPSEVSGVLFTRDPLDVHNRRMLVEASWGLGESVVSGRVAPDRYHLDQLTGAVLEHHIGAKTSMQTPSGARDVPPEMRERACLNDALLTELAALGRQVEALYGDGRDVEWAWAEGHFWLLQARPITVAGAAEREQIRREEIAALAARTAPGGTVWSRYNLAESLPAPTPLSWSLARHLLSGRGGLGMMYRDLGFDPDPALDEEGIFDLIAGRPYCNLSREPRMQSRVLPFVHSFDALKAQPQRALYPQPALDPSKAGWRFWAFLPWVMIKLIRSAGRVDQINRTLAQRLREEIFPTFAAEADREAEQDLTSLDTLTLLERFDYWVRRTLVDFARDSLKPTALAALALGKLQEGLVRTLGPVRTTAALGELTLAIRPDAEADLPAALGELAAGHLDRAEFLRRFGHRGQQEMELARPRWSEDPSTLATPSPSHPLTAPSAPTWERIATEAQLPAARRTALEAQLEAARSYLSLRETAKHYLMKGYAVIRRIALELDRRNHLNGGIFYLTPEELPLLAVGEDLSEIIAGRRRRRSLALSLELPQVIFSDDLEAIGRPTVVGDAGASQGVPLSAGEVEGPALVLTEPAAPPTGEPYILVCPSTDPAWVPLFVGACGLVMETGGVLSHGAIVAREFGLPAVAGLPDILRRLRTGQRLRINGATGTVMVLPEEA
jgi:pyruvate,water dikinase